MKKKKNKEVSPEVVMSREEYEALEKKAVERDEWEAKWLKVHAEYENTRKRLEKEKYDHMKFANEGIIFELFPIVDNFDMALMSMDKAEDKDAVMDGIKLVQKQFHKILEENGVKRIETTGKRFDPNVHEAVAAENTPDIEEDMILEELRPGYMLNDRLLRPAQVKVAKNEEKDTGQYEIDEEDND
jgi:molecular chaperone GrpE